MKKIFNIILLLFLMSLSFALIIQANEALRVTAQVKQTSIKIQKLREDVKQLAAQVENFNPNIEEDLPPIKADKLIPMGEYEITYYCSCKKCCRKTDGITASGVKAVDGITVGADTKILPFGTVIHIEGLGERTVQDRGGAIKGNKLDVFVSSHQKALELGRNKAKVFIIEKE